MLSLFEVQRRRLRDRREIEMLLRAHGPDALLLAWEWAGSRSLSKRSRKHWRRIAHKLGRLSGTFGSLRAANFTLQKVNADDGAASPVRA
jgi:hypothetical protein